MSKALIWGGTFIVMGVAFFLYSIYNRHRAEAAITWPTVEGTIIRSAMLPHEGTGSNDYYIDLAYDYTVNGVHHEEEGYAFGGASGTKSAMLDVLHRYPVGVQAVVHYDPDDPENSVLDVSSSDDAATGNEVGKALIVLGILFLAVGLYQRRRGTQKPE